MANKYIAPAYGIPERFKTPEQQHQERLAEVGAAPRQPSQGSENSSIPGVDFFKTLGLTTASSFVSGFAADAKTLDYMFDADPLKKTGKALSRLSNYINTARPEVANKSSKKMFIRDDGSLGKAWSDIYSYADLAGSGIGSIAAMIAGGGLLKLAAKGLIKGIVRKSIRKGADKLAIKEGITHELALKKATKEMAARTAKYNTALGTAAYGSAEAMITSGSVGMAIEQEIMRAPAEVLNKSDTFKKKYFELVDKGMDSDTAHNTARIWLSREAGIEGAKNVAVPTFLLGSFTGHFIEKAISGSLTKSALKNFAILEASEIPTEAAQGATEQYFQNKAYKDLVDGTRNLMAGVPDSALREGLGVAFGVAPLSLINARAEAKRAKGGPDAHQQEMLLIDAAAKYDSAATEAALEIQDPEQRHAVLVNIIRKAHEDNQDNPDDGNDPPASGGGAVQQPTDSTPDTPPGETPPAETPPTDPITTPEVVPPAETPPAETPPAETPPAETPPAETPPTEAPPTETPPTETPPTETPPTETPPTETPPVTPPVETPPVETPPTETPPTETPPSEAPNVPAYKVDFETFKQGVKANTYTPDAVKSAAASAAFNAGNINTSINPSDLLNMSRAEINSVGKSLGINTVKGRSKLSENIAAVSDFANIDINNISTERAMDELKKLNKVLKNPYKVPTNEDQAIAYAGSAQTNLAARGENAYLRQQHRDAIEQGIDSGDFTMQDFNALPEEDQKAYADIGRRLAGLSADVVRGGQPEPLPDDETNGNDNGGTNDGSGGNTGGGGAIAGGSGGDTTEGGAGTTEGGTKEGSGTTEEGTTPETPGDKANPEDQTTTEDETTPTETDEAQQARIEAVQNYLDTVQEGQKVKVSGQTLSGQKPMNDEKLTFVGKKNDFYIFSKGKTNKYVKRIDGKYYLTSISGKRSREITEITNAQMIKKDSDGSRGGRIRRPHEMWKKTPRNLTDADQLVEDILNVVAHAQYVKGADYTGKSLGVRRMYKQLMHAVPQFLNFVGPYIGAERGVVTPTEALLAIARNEPLTQYDSENQYNLQTIDDVLQLVDAYVEMLGEIQDFVNDSSIVNVKTFRDALAEKEFTTRTDTVYGQNAETYTLQAVIDLDDSVYEFMHETNARDKKRYHGIDPDFKTENSFSSDFAPMFPKLSFNRIHQMYKKEVELENVEDSKRAKRVPRPRRKLSELAAERTGMPDHRKGRHVSTDEIIDTFGFMGVTYGDWVKDDYIEGETVSEQQQYRDLVYDSFSDLAYMTGLPLKVMGSHLYLSLGASGHGKKTGLAFFHPHYKQLNIDDEETESNKEALRNLLKDKNIAYDMSDNAATLYKKIEGQLNEGDVDYKYIRMIHFNRSNGDGSVAHEWTHNFGNRLERVEHNLAETLKMKPSISALHRTIKVEVAKYIRNRGTEYNDIELLQNLKTRLEKALRRPDEFMRPTSYYKNSRYMDVVTGHAQDPYWSNKFELLARATEAHIFDAIMAEGDGAFNPFLQGESAAEGFISPENGYIATVYPEKAERAYFNELIKQMFIDTKASDSGEISFDQNGEDYHLRFGVQVEFDRLVKEYQDNLDQIIADAEISREESLLNDDLKEENLLEGMSDDDLREILYGSADQPEEESGGRRPGGDRTGGRTGGGRRGGRGESTPRPKPKPVGQQITDSVKRFGGSQAEIDILNRLLGGGEGSASLIEAVGSIDEFTDTMFSLADVGERNPDLDPEIYVEIGKVLSVFYGTFVDSGNSIKDFGRELADGIPELFDQFDKYVFQFLKDVRDGNVNYREYMGAPTAGANEAGEGSNDGSDASGANDQTNVSEPTDEQVSGDNSQGTEPTGATEETQSGQGGVGTTGVDTPGVSSPPGLTLRQIGEWIQEKIGLRSPLLEPLPVSLGRVEAQIPKVPIAKQREGEGEYQVPTAMADNMEKSILNLEEQVGDLDQYVMDQLGYTDRAQFDEAFMSLQVETIAAAIHQMSSPSRRSIIIADQTGVGKGRQGGGLIRWAIKNGKIPIFVTENEGLYTDMYYDMVDSFTTDVNPFITNTDGGIKDRNAPETEDNIKKPPLIHKIPSKETKEKTESMAKDGKMPEGTNAIFTTYSQINKENSRRDAIRKLIENNDVVLILDESHKAAKFDRTKLHNTNAFLTEMIKQAYGTTYLSATFAKNPQNLAFYFNTDLADAMDGMAELVHLLTTGGIQLQEQMSRALTRSGQLFRREIDYSKVDIRTEFNTDNLERDKDNINRLTDAIQSAIRTNQLVTREMNALYGNDAMAVAAMLRQSNQIDDDDVARIDMREKASGEKLGVNFTNIANQIHTLTDQISVASKSDIAVDKIVDDIKNGRKPVIGLDKTNMSMLNEYVSRMNKNVGDDMSDLSWAGLMEFWVNKSLNVSIPLGRNIDPIKGNLGDMADLSQEARNSIQETIDFAKQQLEGMDLPLSPIDYIMQKAEYEVKKQQNKKINVKEITGRFSGAIGLDYTKHFAGEGPITLYKVNKFEKRDIIDGFNGEIKDKDGNKLPSIVDAIIINQSGSTGVSLHSSLKHGDRRDRHMIILEPSGDINVFQQMLGRIFRTGMGETTPYYTILGSGIPSDARKINVLRKKMQSLNAQTSSNKEGSAGVDVKDIMNEYGDAAVYNWATDNTEFRDMFPNWASKQDEEKGFAYWATGKLALFNFKFQEDAYKDIMSRYDDIVSTAKMNGLYSLEETFYDWKAEYLEEWTIVEPRHDNTGFGSGAYLVKVNAQSNFNAMNAESIKDAIKLAAEGREPTVAELSKNKDAKGIPAKTTEPNQEKDLAITKFADDHKEQTSDEIDSLRPENDNNRSVNKAFESYKEAMKSLLNIYVRQLLGVDNNASRFTEKTVYHYKAILDQNRGVVVENLPKKGMNKTKFKELEQRLEAKYYKPAWNRFNEENVLKRFQIGKTYTMAIGENVTAHAFVGTVISHERHDNTIDPYQPGNFEVVIAADRQGGTTENGLMSRSVGQLGSMASDLVSEEKYDSDPSDEKIDNVLKKYHETLAQTNVTTEEYVVVGNPLVAKSEIRQEQVEWIQFTDSENRRFSGLKIPSGLYSGGAERMIRMNLEIPHQGGAKIITDYIKENPYSKLSREEGFTTGRRNVVILNDSENDEHIRIEFNKRYGADKANDPPLQEAIKALGIRMMEFKNEYVMSIPYSEAQPIVSLVLDRSRLKVSKSQRRLLRNYMDVSESVRAGADKVVIVSPDQVKTYVFDDPFYGSEGNKITFHRGNYRPKSWDRQGKPKDQTLDGFYIEGWPKYRNLNNIARLTMMKGLEGENKGRPFITLDEFKRGNVKNGYDGGMGLGDPIFNQSTRTDGTKFSVGDVAKGSPITREAAAASLEGLPKDLSKRIHVVQSESELPLPVKIKINKRKIQGRVRGVFHNGKIYIVADALSVPEEAMVVFLHEAIGHLGIKKLFGSDMKGKQLLRNLLNQVAELYPEEMNRLGKKYKIDTRTQSGREEVAEEVLAHIAERDVKPTIWDKIVSVFRRLVRYMGLNLHLSKQDVINILAAARESVEEGGFSMGGYVPQAQTLFSVQSSTAEQNSTTKTTPKDTVLQGIKDGQPVDAVFRGIWGIAEATQLPKLTRIASAKTLRAAVDFYNDHMSWSHSFVDHVARGLIDNYKLDSEYVQLKANRSSKIAMITDEVRDIIEVMTANGVTNSNAALIQEILVNESPRQDAWDAVTEPIRKRIEQLGQEAVDLNLITQDAYDRNKGAYLHRVYSKYEQNRTGLQKWADQLSGKRYKIAGQETMERGKSIFPNLSKMLETLGDEQVEIGEIIYKVNQMTSNGQRVLRTYYSDKPFSGEGYTSEKYTVRARHGNRVKLHRDWTKSEREDMGEIVDARYTVGKTFALLAHDLASGEFFDTIANNEAWTLPPDIAKEKIAAGEVMSAKSATQFGGVVTGAEWIQVPEARINKSQAKAYGALAGRVVRAEIYQDINQLQNMQKAGWWKTVLTAFKLNKTARNPVVHFNNVMSNFVLMDMADVRFSDLYRAIHEMRNKGALYKEAKANSAFGASFAETELQNEVLNKLIDEIHEVTGTAPVGLEAVVMSFDNMPLQKQVGFLMKIADSLWHGVDIPGGKVGLKQLDRKMLQYYQHEDEVFRMATYMRRRSQGMGMVEAGISARDQFLNYDISAPWINAARATVLPFVSYTYRAIPIVAKSLMNRPWKLAKYFTIAYGMNAVAYALTGGDEDKERKSLRDEVSGKLWIGADRLIRMPWNNEEGNPYFWDIRRLIPIGDVMDLNQYHAALPIIPASVMPSGPIAMTFEFLFNKTAFFGEEIVDPLADDPVIATQKVMDWAWKSYAPSAPWIPASYYWDKISIATKGGRDKLGRQYKILPALASSLGIKINVHDVSYGMAMKGLEIGRTVEAIRHNLITLEKDRWQGKISKSSYEATKKRYTLKLKRLDAKAKELFQQ